MAKKKKKQEEQVEVKALQITAAAMADGRCNYSYEVTDGVNVGDTHSVKGKGVFTDDLMEAFRKFNRHLASIDDGFRGTDEEDTIIDKLENSVITANYHVEGFKMKGSAENQTVSLAGSKFVTCSGERMTISTPRIPLDSGSSYKWHAELAEATAELQAEVELYMNGKCEISEDDLPENNKQMKITDVMDVEFEKAAL